MSGTSSSNTYLNGSTVAKEMLRLIINNLVVAKNVKRKYAKEWKGDRKIGDTLTIRRPGRYTIREGKVVSLNDFSEKTVTLTIDRQIGVDVAFDSADLAMKLDDFSKQVLAPQIAALANAVDLSVLKEYVKVPAAVGTPGATTFDLDTFLDAGVKLDNEATPVDDQRGMVVNPRTQAKAVNALKGLFNSQSELKSQYEKGRMGTAAGFDFAMSQNIVTHTVGNYSGTPLINGAAQTGSSLATDGWGTSITGLLKKGDIFTIAGVYSVNPMSKESTQELRQFVVTADVASNGSGLATLPIYPSIVGPGDKEQTVSALPGDNAAITVLGAAGAKSATNLGYHPDAFEMVTVDLPLPKGMDIAERVSSEEAGISIRFVRGYDITNDRFISRLDILFGVATVYPEFAVRVQA